MSEPFHKPLSVLLNLPQPVITAGHALYIINKNIVQGLDKSFHPVRTASMAVIRTGGGGLVRSILLNQKPPLLGNPKFIPICLAAWYASGATL